MKWPKNSISKGRIFISDKTNLMLIDRDTGEVVKTFEDGCTIISPEERQRRSNYWQHVNNSMKSYSSEGFIFYLYNDESKFSELSSRTAARIIYLATYLSYDDNILYSTQRKKTTKSTMREALGLSVATFYEFLDEATESGILHCEDGCWKLSPFSFRKGGVGKAKYDVLVKLYTKTIRDLYKSTPKKFHQYLGYVFLLVPYVNTEWNIVCHNPFEPDLDCLEPMTVGEFCDAIGYHRSNAKALVKNFRTITFSCRGEQQRFCTFVYEPEKENMRIFVNPNIMYTGKHPENVEALGAFF